MSRIILAIAFSILAFASAEATIRLTSERLTPNVVVVFETSLGNFEISVDVDHAPITAANFLKYVDDGAYNKGFFHRTVRPDTESRKDYPIQVVQASPAKGTANREAIKLERTNVTGLKHFAGTVSMARSGADTATSDFFICITDSPELDFGGRRNADGQGFAAFGKVITGMDIVKKIQASPTKAGENGKQSQSLEPQIVILKAYRKK